MSIAVNERSTDLSVCQSLLLKGTIYIYMLSKYNIKLSIYWNCKTVVICNCKYLKARCFNWMAVNSSEVGLGGSRWVFGSNWTTCAPPPLHHENALKRWIFLSFQMHHVRRRPGNNTPELTSSSPSCLKKTTLHLTPNRNPPPTLHQPELWSHDFNDFISRWASVF